MSSFANLLSVDNRLVMLVLRFSIMIFSYVYIYIFLRDKKMQNYFNLWVFSVVLFWFFYLIRLFFDVYVSGVALALPLWELLAWSLGSSLPIAICSYILASQQSLDSVLIRQVKYGVILLGASIICFVIDPGLSQGRFYLEHLNAITCANAGCSLVLLCFARIILCKVNSTGINSGRLITCLGIFIGSFIIIYSATRGVLLASLLIISASVLLLRSRLNFTALAKTKYSLQLVIGFSVLVLLISTSPHLVEKLFTSRSAVTVLTRLEFWKVSFEQFVANPFLGIGFHLQEILGKLEIEKGIYYPHNYLFESLAIGGISMTLPLLYCMFSPLVSFYKELRIDPSVLPSGLMAAQALVYSMHNGHLGDFPFFWMAIGIIAGSRYRINPSNAVNRQFEN
ncbi:O-antigen ligase [Synechococcus sp. TAK9802]|uniref:O-antigen ligase family protein n=1 Tax=Synechococcus sp. TAK9802 TaxID=1442558 RepID=UPI0016490BB1|nr:O-antigen ligase family protein [Synechococcus sp. TAK9802]